jgi:hypothetical protein
LTIKTMATQGSEIYLGMHVIANEQTRWGWLSLLLLIMLIMSLILLRWADKQGWWCSSELSEVRERDDHVGGWRAATPS